MPQITQPGRQEAAGAEGGGGYDGTGAYRLSRLPSVDQATLTHNKVRNANYGALLEVIAVRLIVLLDVFMSGDRSPIPPRPCSLCFELIPAGPAPPHSCVLLLP